MFCYIRTYAALWTLILLFTAITNFFFLLLACCSSNHSSLLALFFTLSSRLYFISSNGNTSNALCNLIAGGNWLSTSTISAAATDAQCSIWWILLGKIFTKENFSRYFFSLNSLRRSGIYNEDEIFFFFSLVAFFHFLSLSLCCLWRFDLRIYAAKIYLPY